MSLIKWRVKYTVLRFPKLIKLGSFINNIYPKPRSCLHKLRDRVNTFNLKKVYPVHLEIRLCRTK